MVANDVGRPRREILKAKADLKIRRGSMQRIMGEMMIFVTM
jgi:hypothetical protein